jgi:hypothetical protein
MPMKNPAPDAARLRRGKNAGARAGHLDQALRSGLKAGPGSAAAVRFHHGLPLRPSSRIILLHSHMFP